MAKSEQKPKREPGRFRQLLKIYAATAKNDKGAVGLALLGLLVPTLLGLGIASIVEPGNVIVMILWTVLGRSSCLRTIRRSDWCSRWRAQKHT